MYKISVFMYFEGMLKGVVFAIAACLAWGLTFVLPGLIKSFSVVEIALGRHFFYGLASLAFFSVEKWKGSFRYSYKIWLLAAFSSGSLISISSVIASGARYANPTICALILGLSPIIIACCGNWKSRDYPYKPLIVSSLLIVAGMVVLHFPAFDNIDFFNENYLLGILLAIFGTILWSVYVLFSGLFLKKVTVDTTHWSSLMGITALGWVVIGMFFLDYTSYFSVEKYSDLSDEFAWFVACSAVLGVICSWIGNQLWSCTALYLPLALAGQLTIFETIFGVVFAHIVGSDFPTFTEFLGITLFIFAIFYSLNQLNAKALNRKVYRPLTTKERRPGG